MRSTPRANVAGLLIYRRPRSTPHCIAAYQIRLYKASMHPKTNRGRQSHAPTASAGRFALFRGLGPDSFLFWIVPNSFLSGAILAAAEDPGPSVGAAEDGGGSVRRAGSARRIKRMGSVETRSPLSSGECCRLSRGLRCCGRLPPPRPAQRKDHRAEVRHVRARLGQRGVAVITEQRLEHHAHGPRPAATYGYSRQKSCT